MEAVPRGSRVEPFSAHVAIAVSATGIAAAGCGVSRRGGRSQIDRLTPWSAAEAAFHWTAPVAATDGRVRLTIAATVRSMIVPYQEAIASLGAASIAVVRSRPSLATAPFRSWFATCVTKRCGKHSPTTRAAVLLLTTGLGAAAS